VLTSRSSLFLDGPLPRDSRSQVQASKASIHTSVTVSRLATVLGFFMALFHSLDIADSIMEGVDDLNVLDVRNSILGIVEMLDVVAETLIMLLLDGLEGLSSGWMLVCALEVLNEHGTQLVPGVDGFFE
jgi:hypothetical protein